MSTYGAMQRRIAAELGRDELLPRIPDAIQSALRFYEAEPLWFLQNEATALTVAGTNKIAVPTDFIEGYELSYADGSQRIILEPRTWAWMRDQAESLSARGIPTHWAYFADQFWFYPTPDAIYTLQLSYLRRLPALASDGDTNAWMTHGEELIRCRAMMDLTSHLGGEISQSRAGLCVMALENLQRKNFQKIASRRLSIDEGLLQGDYGFNINHG